MQFKPDTDGHIFLLHPDELAPLAARAGLELEKVSLSTNPLTNGHMKTEFLLRLLPRPVVEGLENLSRRLPASLTNRLLTQLAVRFRRPG